MPKLEEIFVVSCISFKFGDGSKRFGKGKQEGTFCLKEKSNFFELVSHVISF